MQEKMIFEAHMNEKLCYTEIMKRENGCKGTARRSFFWTTDLEAARPFMGKTFTKTLILRAGFGNLMDRGRDPDFFSTVR